MVDKQPIRDAITISKFKIEWAKQHISGVENLIKQIIADNSNVISINNDSNPAIVHIGPNQLLPVNLPLHLGDAIHNLNGVTDYLWYGVARAVGSTNVARLSFPRHETRQNLANSIDDPRGVNATIYETIPEAKGFILDIIKPYKGGDTEPSLLWHLNKLDNINKHRFLLVVAHLTRFDREFSFIGSDGGRITISSAASIQTQGQPLPAGLTPPVKIDNDPVAIIDVVFSEPDHFTGKPVLETLVDLANSVAKLIDLFEIAFA